MSQTPRIVGRSERDALYDALCYFAGVLSFLPREGENSLVGNAQACIFLADLLDRALVARVEAEEEKARQNRKELRAKSIRVEDWRIFKDATTARKELERFRRNLEEARAADEKKRLEREEKGGDAPAEAPAAEERTGTEG